MKRPDNVFKRLRRAFDSLFSDTTAKINGQWGKLISSTSSTIVGLTSAGSGSKLYENSLAVSLSVNAITNAIASLPLQIFDENGDDISDRPEYEILYRPNTVQTRREFIALSQINWELHGNALWALERDERDRVIQMLVLQSDHMQVIPDKDNFIKVYRYTIGGETIDIPPRNIIHWKYPNPQNPWWGLSPLVAAMRHVGLNWNALSYGEGFFANGARLSGALEVEGGQALGDKEFDRMRDQFSGDYTGVDNMHKVMVLEGATYKPISVAPKDVEFTELLRVTKSDIAAAFGVTPIMLNDLKEASVLANADQQKLTFWENGVIPRTTYQEAAYTELILPALTPVSAKNKKAIAKYDLSGIEVLQDVKDKKVERARKARGTINEVRIAGGLPEIDDELGQVILVPIGEVPLESAVDRSQLFPGAGQSSSEKALPGSAEKRATLSKNEIFLKKHQLYKARKIPVMERDVKSFFNDQEDAVMKAYRAFVATQRSVETREVGNEVGNEIFDVGHWTKEFAEFMTPAQQVMMMEAGNIMFSHYDLAGTIAIDDPMMLRKLGIRIDTFSEINDTTLASIIDELTDGFTAGESFDEVGARIQGVFTDANKVRARMIAKTEINYAQNAGNQIAMENAGVRKKKWMWSGNIEHLRDEHLRVDGQEVMINSNFFVGNESLSAPGQGSDPANNINCNCVSVPSA